jgi:hypothetical protein
MARNERKTEVINLLDSANGTNIPVLFTNGNVWTKSVYIGDAVSVSIVAQMGLVATTGSAKMTLQVEQSPLLPAVEGSVHASYLSTNTVMVTFATVSTYTSNAITLGGYPYLRCKITPTTPNTSAYVNIILTKQVEG